MSSHIYVDMVTVGGVQIFQVTSDPNGALEAPQGSIAISNTGDDQTFQNVDGGTAWVSTGGAIRRSYGSVPVAFRSDPVPVVSGDLSVPANWGVAQIIGAFDNHYNRCYVDFLYSDGTRITRQRFASLDDLTAWLNANIPQTGGICDVTVIMEAYDLVDPGIEKVTKIWGENSAMGRLLGDSKFWHGNKVVTDPSWTLTNDALKAMFLEAHGFDPFPAAGAWTTAERACFWFSTNRRRRYHCAWQATSTVTPPVPGLNGRNMVTAGGAINATSADTPFNWAGGQRPCYMAVDTDGSAFSVDRAEATGFTDQARSVVGGKSLLFGLPLTDGVGNFCLQLKAMGQDMFYTNYLDPTRYRVEVVGGEGYGGHQGLRVLDTHAGFQDIGGNTMGHWNLSELINVVGTGWGATVHGHGDLLGMIRMQVRDLTTNRVSDLSDPCIRFGGRNRYVQIPVLVKDRPR